MLNVSSKWSKLTKNQLNIKLIEGCNYANISLVEQALRLGANINCRRAFDYVTVFHIAAEHGNVDLIRLLCDQPNAKIESKTLHGLTALHTATLLGHIEVVIELLNRGVNPNCTDNLDRYPLHYASLRSNIQMAKILINRKALINAFDAFQESPLYQSVLKRPNIEMVKLLLKHGAEFMETPNGTALGLFFEAILCAHREIDIEILNIFFKQGINVNVKDPIGWRTPLHFVAVTGYENLAKFLLKNGADPYLKNRAGLTPYEVACSYRNLNIILLLEEILTPRISTNET